MFLLILLGAALFGAHVALTRTRHGWAGAVVPAVWIAGVVALVAAGRTLDAQHAVAAAAGLVGLLGAWAEMRHLRLAVPIEAH